MAFVKMQKGPDVTIGVAVLGMLRRTASVQRLHCAASVQRLHCTASVQRLHRAASVQNDGLPLFGNCVTPGEMECAFS
jgi:hypothetical protein